MSLFSHSASFLKTNADTKPPPRQLVEKASSSRCKLHRSQTGSRLKRCRQLHEVVVTLAKNKTDDDENHDSDDDSDDSDDAFIQQLLLNNNNDEKKNESRYDCHSLEDFLDRKSCRKSTSTEDGSKCFRSFPTTIA